MQRERIERCKAQREPGDWNWPDICARESGSKRLKHNRGQGMPITRRTLLKIGMVLPPLSYAYALGGVGLARAGSGKDDVLPPERRDQLLEDARAAWQFF